jgi:hypothetical protein
MKNLVILFEYLQSISGENLPPNTWTIITCMKQRMHLLATHSIYVLGREKRKKNEGAVLQVYGITFSSTTLYSSTIIYFILFIG